MFRIMLSSLSLWIFSGCRGYKNRVTHHSQQLRYLPLRMDGRALKTLQGVHVWGHNWDVQDRQSDAFACHQRWEVVPYYLELRGESSPRMLHRYHQLHGATYQWIHSTLVRLQRDLLDGVQGKHIPQPKTQPESTHSVCLIWDGEIIINIKLSHQSLQ